MTPLSPTTLKIIEECSRCFYLEAKKILSRPRGIFSSLPNAFDRVLKTQYDKVRPLLPADISSLNGKLAFDNAKIKKYRHWKSAPNIELPEYDILLRCGFDDVFEEPDGKLSPMDYKTTGKAPDQAKFEGYYSLQMSIQSYILEKAGHEVSGKAYLPTYYPEGSMDLQCEVITLETDHGLVDGVLQKASDILASDKLPDPEEGCDYCEYVEKYLQVLESFIVS